MVNPVKTQVENGLNKTIDFQGRNIYVADQGLFVITDEVIHE